MTTIVVPATLANLGSGYDTLGAAIHLTNTFVIRPESRGSDDLVRHTAEVAGRRFGVACPPFRVDQDEQIPRSRGLGSSATARVAGFLAWQSLTKRLVPEQEVLDFLSEEEGHPDNVWPAYLGGLVICGAVARRLTPAAGLWLALASPDVEISTERARRLLPERVRHRAAVENVQAIALLLAGLLTGDMEALRAGVIDRLHQPFRVSMLGPVMEAFEGARRLGGAPFVSGSGSTLAAFTTGSGEAINIAAALAAPYRSQGTPVTTRVVRMRMEGATVRP